MDNTPEWDNQGLWENFTVADIQSNHPWEMTLPKDFSILKAQADFAKAVSDLINNHPQGKEQAIRELKTLTRNIK